MVTSDATIASLGRYWRSFADYSLKHYAPKYDRIVRAMADDPEVMALVAAAPGDAHSPNNLHASVHYLLFDQPEHPLAAVYRGESEADPVPLFAQVVHDHRDTIAELLATRKVQTNEVARCAALAPALASVGAGSTLPLSLIDIGCSAGLNLGLDRYFIDYGSRQLGPRDATVHIDAELRGAEAPLEELRIAWRRGYDRSPIDLRDADAARWLRSLVWPDHPDRALRLDAAIADALAHPTELVVSDAVDAVADALATAPADTLAVIVTSWVVFYFDDDTRAGFVEAVERAERPVRWVSMEMEGVVTGLDLRDKPDVDHEVSVMAAVSSDGDCHTRRDLLGWCHPHGAWVHWVAH